MKKNILLKFLPFILIYLKKSVCLAQIPSIIIILSIDIPPYKEAVKGFSAELKEKNDSVKINVYNLSEENILEKVKCYKPDLILTVGTSATNVITENIKDIPIVFSMVLDPKGSGFKSENITGASLDIPISVQFKYIKKVIPDIKKIGVIYNSAENEDYINLAKQEITNFNISLKTYPIKFVKEIPKFDNLDIDLLWLVPDSLVCQPTIIKNLLISGLKHRISIFGVSHFYAKAGALMALSCNYEDIGRQAGEITMEILEGKSINDISFSLPRNFHLYLNLAVANRIGIKINKDVIEEAIEVFGK